MPRTVEWPASMRAYVERIGAIQVNFFKATVREYHGNYYSELAVIRIERDRTISCSHKVYKPTEEEEAAINAELAECEFPHSITVRDPRGIREAGATGDLWELYDSSGMITMVLERPPSGEGIGKYVYWSKWDDGQWYRMEHDKPYLPFWRHLDNINTYGETIFIHEGAKTAEFIDRMIREKRDDHPFYEDLKDGIHWGMVGGAYGAHRMDWDDLARQKPERVIYICDNDGPGKTVLKDVSREWKRSLVGVMFGDDFPPSFDLADPIPGKLFSKRTGKYKGPLFQKLMQPATYAMTTKIGAHGKYYHEITKDFQGEWFATVLPEAYVHKDWPNLIYNGKEFNNVVRPFSPVDDTSRFLKQETAGKAVMLKYSPNLNSGFYGGGDDGVFINTHVPSPIQPKKGDAGPFLDFMENFIEGDTDRREILRWCATLVCRPDIRMHYGLLLISETQGVGKGTLGEKILAPLVGDWNVSYPSEHSIVDSNFNGWIAHKRLAIVHEIYAGQNNKAYDKLKQVITDKNVEVNKKFVAEYNIACWCHIFACSNSVKALKLEDDDRRWLVPLVSSNKREPKYWEDFNSWLIHDDGLAIIKWWLGEFLKTYPPVITGEAAPFSSMKQEVILEGYSAGMSLIYGIMKRYKDEIDDNELRINGHKVTRAAYVKTEGLVDGKKATQLVNITVGKSVFFTDKDLQNVIRNHLHGGKESVFLERLLTCRKVAKALGFHVGKTQCRVDGYGKARLDGRVLSLDPDVADMTPGRLYESGIPLLNLDDYVEF